MTKTAGKEMTMEKVGVVYRTKLVERIKEGIGQRNNIFILSYSGLSGLQMNTFRKDLKKVGANVFVPRNSLAQLALKDLKFDQLAQRIAGQTAFIWSDADSVLVSKTIVKFVEGLEGVSVQGGVLDGKLLGKSEVERLSKLPSREVLLVQLLQNVQSPIAGVVNALSGKLRELLYLLKKLEEQEGGK